MKMPAQGRITFAVAIGPRTAYAFSVTTIGCSWSPQHYSVQCSYVEKETAGGFMFSASATKHL